MGLDWSPMAKPRPGFEEEFITIFRALEGEPRSESELQARLDRFREISDPPHTLMGAPRVGYDGAADQWLRERLERAGRQGEYDTARKEMHGYYVLDLLPPCDGFPPYSNYGAYEGLDRYSFRGSFLQDVEDVLGPELMAQAHRSMLADELERYGTKLLETARSFARAHGVERVEHEPPPDGDEGSPASRAHVIFAAAKWCLFWARRGHGLEPWF